MARARRVPSALLLISALLAIAGAGSIVGAGYLILARGMAPGAGALFALIAGPAFLYLAYHLLRLAPWTWRALIVLLLLLLLTSLLRLAFATGPPRAAIAEIVLEVALLLYLLRPAVRAKFAGLPVSRPS